MDIDWQVNLKKIKHRGQYLLQSEKLVDCRFLVGTSSNQCIISGHRLILAMASPVFEVMFYGSLPEICDPIEIPDVHPNAFKAMLDYIYTDGINMNSFDETRELCYLGKKYMLPHVVDRCMNFLCSDVSPENACRAYEFGKFFEETRLMETSMEVIGAKTREVIADPSFMDIDFSTFMAILDKNQLNIDSELDLFNCLLQFANERDILDNAGKDNSTDADSENASDVVVEEIEMETEDPGSAADSASSVTCDSEFFDTKEVVVFDSDGFASANEPNIIEDSSCPESVTNINYIMIAHHVKIDEDMLRQAVKKIRFLTMTPLEFAEGPGRSKLLHESEALAILTKLVSPTINDCPMPEGFTESRKRDTAASAQEKKYCLSEAYRLIDSHETDSTLTFKVDRNIYVVGVQVNCGVQFPHNISSICKEEFCAYIQKINGAEFTISHEKENVTETLFNITFKTPFYVQRNEKYKIHVTFNKIGHYLLSSWQPEMISNGVHFSFYISKYSESSRGAIIRAIIFVTPQDHSKNMIQ